MVIMRRESANAVGIISCDHLLSHSRHSFLDPAVPLQRLHHNCDYTILHLYIINYTDV